MPLVLPGADVDGMKLFWREHSFVNQLFRVSEAIADGLQWFLPWECNSNLHAFVQPDSNLHFLDRTCGSWWLPAIRFLSFLAG